MKAGVASAAGAVVLVTAVWIVLHLGWYPHGQIVDYPIYERYGAAMIHAHEVPYRDFRLEYQPAALPTFLVPAALDALGFRAVFQGLMAFCHLALVLTVLRVSGRRAAAVAAIAPLLLGSVVLSRFDLWPAALAGVALWLLISGRHAGSAVILATGFAAKVWPVVLVPFICVWLWRRQGRRAAVAWVGIALATAAAWFLPFVALSPRGVGHSFYLQIARPLQIESLAGTVLVALHVVAGTPVGVLSDFGSQNVVGHGAGVVTTVTTVVEVLAVAACWVVFVRGEQSTQRLLLACAAAVAALLAFGKVFSPQYLIWLFALVPLARRAAPTAIYAVALVLTQAYFPRRYWDFASGLYRAEVGIVLLRDLVVVALFATLTVALYRARAPRPVSAAVGADGRPGRSARPAAPPPA